MLKKLKTKFIIATIIALGVIMTIIIGAINVVNYRSVILDADKILEVINDNAGKFPSKPGSIDPDIDINFTPESPYESRYFTVVFKGENLLSVNTESIAAVNDETAVKMANWVTMTGIKRGFHGNYRYLFSNDGDITRVIFLDCTKSLDYAHTFLILSASVSIMGVLVVLLILWVVSERVVKPINDGYEKQRRFITDAGHDIKTPITIIDADAELLEMEIGENEWLTDIKKQAQRLAKLTGELIYLSRMEERREIPHIDFPISDVTEEVLASFTAFAKTRKITVKDSISPAIYYCGDEDAIRKLITILLENAIKYSPEGETIEIVTKKQGRNVVFRTINVTHSIDDETMTHMFDRFYRSDPARSSSGGFGIGLSVATAIVDAHKGKISAQKDGDLLIVEVVL